MKYVRPVSLPKRPAIPQKFYVFDTETWGLDGRDSLAFGVVYGYNYKKVLYTREEFQKEFKKERYAGTRIFAHNAEFDLTVIFGNIYENLDSSAIFNGKFISANYYGAMFCDSLNIFPSSLEKIGKSLGYPKGITPQKFIDGDRSQGITQEDIDYCVRDCEILYKALLKMFTRIGTVRLTIGSCGMYLFRSKYLHKAIRYCDMTYDFFESYYGGRTEVFKLGKGEYKVADINSLYPSRMIKMKFPNPATLKKTENPRIAYFEYILKKYEGYAKIKVHHKESYIGLLPKKHKINKSEKLIFPIGTFTTYVNFNELRFALSTGLIEILEVEYCVYSPPEESIFTEYIDDLYNSRKKLKGLENTIEKLLMNCLYGKWGMRKKYLTTYYEKIPVDLIQELKENKEFFELKTFSSKRQDCFLVTKNKQAEYSFFTIPSYASYITSEARIKMVQGLLDNQKNGLAYCDTDSVFQDGEFVGEISNELGDWKIEDKVVTEIRGLKNYEYVEDGVVKQAIKGVSKNSVKIAENTYKAVKLLKTKAALRQDKQAGTPYEQIKILKHKYDKRVILPDGINTKPIEL